jgi:hypothetical protein
MNKIKIDGIIHEITSIREKDRGYTDVFVGSGRNDRFAHTPCSCHSLPTSWVIDKNKGQIKTNGHIYITNIKENK